MDPSPIARSGVQRGLYALIAVLVVASIAALLVVKSRSEDGATDHQAGVATTTSSTAASDEGATGITPEDVPAVATTTTSSGGPTATTTRQGGAPPLAEEGTPATADPGPMTPTQPGRYPYSSTRTTEGQPASPATRFDVEVITRSSAGGEVRQVFTEKRKDAEPSQRVVWRADAKLEDAFVVALGDDRFECDWTPDDRVLALPLRTGAAWQSSTSCNVSTGSTVFEVRRTDAARVTGARRVKVGTAEVDVWVVSRTTTDVTTRAGAEVDRQDHTIETMWAPRQGLLVREVRQTVERTPSETFRRVDERRLQRLTPG